MLLSMSVIAGFLLAAFGYGQLFEEKSVGPAAILGLFTLGSIFLVSLVSYLLIRTRYRNAVINTWLVALSVAVTYVIVDLFAGYLLIRPLSPPLVPDPYVHHKLVPDSYSQFEQRDFRYVQRVNNLGLRGRDLSPTKPPKTLRILMLGDSFTMGKGVEDDQTFSALLENSLNQSRTECAGKSVEVLNAGVDSYAPILSYIQLKRDLLSLEQIGRAHV